MIVSATAPVTLEHTFKTNFVNVYNIFLTQTVIKRKVRKLLGLKFAVKFNFMVCLCDIHGVRRAKSARQRICYGSNLFILNFTEK